MHSLKFEFPSMPRDEAEINPSAVVSLDVSRTFQEVPYIHFEEVNEIKLKYTVQDIILKNSGDDLSKVWIEKQSKHFNIVNPMNRQSFMEYSIKPNEDLKLVLGFKEVDVRLLLQKQEKEKKTLQITETIYISVKSLKIKRKIRMAIKVAALVYSSDEKKGTKSKLGRKPLSTLPRTAKSFQKNKIHSKQISKQSMKEEKENIPISNSFKSPPKLKMKPLFVSSPLKRSHSNLYDDRWSIKQGYAFQNAINLLLHKRIVDLNVADSQRITKKGIIPYLDGEETVWQSNMRHNILHEMNSFYCSSYFSKLRVSVERLISEDKIALREKEAPLENVYLQECLVKLILSINNIWLVFMLSAYIQTSSSCLVGSDLRSLKNLIREKFILDFLTKQDRTGFLRNIVVFMLFVDQVFLHFKSEARLKDYLPTCLFRKQNKGFKSTEEIFNSFSKDFLKHDRNIIRELKEYSTIQEIFVMKQSYFDEYHFFIKDIKNDLRNGLILNKLVTDTLKVARRKLRVPPDSRLQKVFNVKVTYGMLKQFELLEDKPQNDMMFLSNQISLKYKRCNWFKTILKGQHEYRKEFDCLNEKMFATVPDEKSIVDGHYLKILKFLRQLFDSVILLRLISKEKLIKLLSNAYLKMGVQVDLVDAASSSYSLLLLELIQVITSKRGIMVYNFSTCFTDGSVLVEVIAYFQPQIISFCNNFNSSITSMDLFKMALRLLNIKYDILGVSEDIFVLPDTYQTKLFLVVLISTLTDLEAKSLAATKIQKFIIATRDLSRSRSSRFELFKRRIILLQRTIKQYLQKQREFTARSILKLQSFTRMYPTYNQYYTLKKCVIKIQSFLRGSHVMQAFRHIRNCVIIIQRFQRNKSDYILQSNSATLVQSYLRMKFFRRKYVDMKHKTLSIQKVIRGYLSRGRYRLLQQSAILIQSQVRSLNQQRKYSNIRSHVIQLQACVRSFITRKAYCLKASSCSFIQLKFRTIIQQRYFQSIRNTSIKLQAVFRGLIARKAFVKEIESIIMIQSLVRMSTARRMFNNQIKAAITIQAYIKMSIQRNTFVAIKNALILLQSVVRREQAKSQYSKLRRATLVLQARQRMYIAKIRFNSVRNSAIVLQSIARRYSERLKYLNKRTHLIALQSCWRQKLSSKMFNHKKASCILIQSLVRKYQQQRIYSAFLKGMIHLQSYIRMSQTKKLYQDKQSLTIVLQKIVRGYLVKSKFKSIVYKIKLIQANMRGTIARYQLKLKQRNTVLIQSAWRRYKCERSFFISKKLIVRIQACYRMFSARKLYLSTLSIITLLQSNIRMIIEMKRYQLYKKGIVVLQAHIRSYQISNTYQKNRDFIIVLQSFIRKRIAQKKYRKVYHQIVLCQSMWRRYMFRTQFNITLKKAMLIQSIIRRHQALRKFKTSKAAAHDIQKTWRRYYTQQEYIQQRDKAIRVQSIIRSFHVRKSFLCKLKAIELLQSVFRGIIAKRRFIKIYSNILSIQASSRGYICRKQLKKLHKSAIVIQAKQRMTVTRTNFIRILKSCHKMQSTVRMYIIKKKFKATVNDAVVIQSHFRAYSARLMLRKQRLSSTKIQTIFRQYYARSIYITKKQSIIFIQQSYRAYITRKRFLEIVEATLKIQSFLRGSLVREIYETIRYKVTIMQSVVRRYLVCKRMLDRCLSAVIIQKDWRTFFHRSSFLKKKKKIKIIQRFFRSNRQRIRLASSLRGIICLQSVVRGNIVRKSKAAVMINKKLTILRMKRKYDTSNEALRRVPMNERMVRALNWIKTSNKFSVILLAMSELEICTRYSEENARRLLYEEDSKNIMVVFDVFYTVNRSDPHLKGLNRALSVLKNVLCYFEGMFFVLRKKIDPLRFIKKLVEKLQYTNSNSLFSLAVHLLNKQIEYDDTETLNNNPILIKRLEDIVKRRKRGIDSKKYLRLNRLLKKLKTH